jgi:choline dehydrogenase
MLRSPTPTMTGLALTLFTILLSTSQALAVINPSHPQLQLLKRSITSDAASLSSSSFDFVIAGGGLAGLALAARLSEWSNVTVLVVEAGGDGTDVQDQIDIPGTSTGRLPLLVMELTA